jgi:hypothetical protein
MIVSSYGFGSARYLSGVSILCVLRFCFSGVGDGLGYSFNQSNDDELYDLQDLYLR